jgi:hypothetical protein
VPDLPHASAEQRNKRGTPPLEVSFVPVILIFRYDVSRVMSCSAQSKYCRTSLLSDEQSENRRAIAAPHTGDGTTAAAKIDAENNRRT